MPTTLVAESKQGRQTIVDLVNEWDVGNYLDADAKSALDAEDF